MLKIKSETYIGLYANCPLFLSHFYQKLGIWQHILLKFSNIKLEKSIRQLWSCFMCTQMEGWSKFNRSSAWLKMCLKSLHFSHRLYLSVSFNSWNKQWLCSQIALIGWQTLYSVRWHTC
jgi:hypothetical protein